MKKFLHNLLALVLLAVASSAWAAGEPTDRPLYVHWWEGWSGGSPRPTITPDFSVDNLQYRIIDGGVELTIGGLGEHYRVSEMTIPASVTYNGTNYPVIRIGEYAFYESIWIESVTIPEGVKSIGRGAFCRSTLLTDLYLPSSVESIESDAFSYSAITNINLTNGVKTIGSEAFAGCKNLSSVTLGQDVSEIGKEVFGYSFYFESLRTYDVEYIWYTDIKDLYCLSPIPAIVSGSLFDILTYARPSQTMNFYEVTTLHVPAESVELYKQTAPWNQFKTILGDGESSVTETVAKAESIRLVGGRIVGEGVMDVYDLGGRQVARGTTDQLPELPAGFYIVRNASTAAKILVP